MTKLLKITTWGDVTVQLGDKNVKSLGSRKGIALLIYLAVTGETHTRETLATLLWDDRTQERALGNLSVLLSSFRKQLGTFVQIDRQTVGLDWSQPIWVDTVEMTQSLAMGDFPAAMALATGEFLAGFFINKAIGFEEWAVLKREQLRHTLIEAGQAWLVDLLEQNNTERLLAAIPHAQQMLALDPLREESHRQLMMLWLRGGKRSEALGQFEKCRQILATELGVEPMPATTQLAERIRSATPDQHNLPAQLTPFVGRHAEISAITQDLADSDCRMVTLVGAGGMGKTRLALEIARRHVGRFLHGTFFVPLANVTHHDQIPLRIATAIGLTPSRSPQQELLDYLQGKEVLLLLDNFEQLLPAPTFLVDLLRQAPQLKLLVTSQERLHLQAEWVRLVVGLPVPTTSVLSDMADFEAIALFVACAKRVNRDFVVDGGKMPAIIRICQLVAGLPLGIELATSWLSHFDPAEIADELATNFDFLSSRAPDLPPRHRNLRAVFEYAWQRLPDREQRVLANLTLFRDGFTREAAQVVVGANRLVLANLVEKSLVYRSPAGRYGMLAVVGRFASEKRLADFAECEAKHAHYFADWVADWADQPLSPAWYAGLAEVDAEIDNIWACWGWCVENAGIQSDPLLEKMLDNFGHYCMTRGLTQEWSHQLETAIHTHPVSRRLRMGLHNWYGRTLMNLGKFAEATTILTKNLEGGEAEQDLHGLTLAYLGMVKTYLGEFAEGKRFVTQSLAIFEANENRLGFSLSCNLLGGIAQRQGDYEAALALYEQSLPVRRGLGDQIGIAMTLNNMGNSLLALGKLAQAKALYEESLTAFRQLNHRLGMATTMSNAGEAAWRLADFAAAERLHLQSLSMKETLGDKRGMAVSLQNLGEVLLSRGELAGARGYFRRSVRLAEEIAVLPVLLDSLVGMAGLWRALGERELAGRVLGVVLENAGTKGETRERADQLWGDLHAEMGADGMGLATNEEKMTLQACIALI